MQRSKKPSDRTIRRHKNRTAFRKRSVTPNFHEIGEKKAEIVQLEKRLDKREFSEEEWGENLKFCAARLRELMRRDSMSNAELARRIYGEKENGEPFKQAEMSLWARGIRMPGVDDILGFADVFRVKALSFLPEQPEQPEVQAGAFVPDDTCEFETIPGGKNVRFLVNMIVAEEKAYRAYGILRDIRAE